MSLLSAVIQEADRVTTEDMKKYRDPIYPKIKDVTERVQMLTWSLQQYLIDTFVNFTVTKSLEQLNFKNRRVNIEADIEKCTEDVNSLQKKFKTIDDEFTNSWQKLLNSYDYFKDICIAAEGKRILDLANHEFGRFNYSNAILAVKELKNDLRKLKLENNMNKALINMNAQAENQIALYTAHLSVEWEDIFTWSEKKGVHYLTYSLSVQQSDPILLQKVLRSLYITERLNAELDVFSHFFLNQLLHNVIKYNCDIFNEDHIGAIIFNIKINLNDKNKPSYQTIFNNLTAVFGFLQSSLGLHFKGDCSFIEVFASLVGEKFFDKIIRDCIRNNLPSCESTYQQYQDIVVELDLFNKFLIELKFVEAEKSPLNKYIEDTECVLYRKKCDKLLSDVRTLLSESLTYGTLTVGSKEAPTANDSTLNESQKDFWDITKPIFLPKCVISYNVKKIMSKIVDHLNESVKLPEKYQNQLISYVKDIAILYQCIVPKKFKVNLENCPTDIALFFNNCFYLAHGLVGPPWCNILPDQLADKLVVVLLECIQDLRVLGLEKVSLYLQKLKSSINQNIEAKDPSLPWSYEIYEEFDCAINDAVTQMKHLKSCWLNILPSRMYEMSLCTLVQALCQNILERIFGNTKPISEELVYMIAVKVEDTRVDVESLFEEQILFETKINVWKKFVEIPLLLKGQLLEIAELWKKETFSCYTCEEVRQIVKIRFPDDKYRLKILKEIQ